MVKFRGDLKSWRAYNRLGALFGIPQLYDREGNRLDSYTTDLPSKEDVEAARAKLKQEKKQTKEHQSTLPELHIEGDFHNKSVHVFDSHQGNTIRIRSGPSGASGVSVHTEKVVVKHTSTKEHIPHKHMPLRKHVSSKQTSESDTDDEGSDLEEVIHTKHAQSYKSSSKRHIAAKHIPVESDSEESSDPEEVAAKKKHIHTKHAPGKERKKAKKVLPLSDEDSDTLVESETDDESSESEEVAAPKCTKNKHHTSNKHAPIRKTKRTAKPAPPSESESDSSQEESDTEGEEGSESEEVVAPQSSRNKKKAPAKHTSSKKKASTKKTRRVAKPVSPPSSESDSTEEESEESEEESEEDSSEDEEVTAGKEPRRDLETIQMDGYRDDDWSVYEDGMICFMKAKGNSSRKIAQELEREVSEVQIRIQEIMELAEEGGLTIERLGEIYTQDVKKNMKKRKEDAKPKHQAYAETVIDNSDEEPKTKGKGKEKAKVDDTNSNHGKGPSSVHSSSSSESLLSYGTFPPIVVPARERLDMMHTLSRLYPNQKVFYPDSNFSVQDCHALAIAEARYRGQQYAYIQSGFANLTGRYLDTEVLKAKLAQGINPYDQTYVNWGGYRQY